MTMRNSMAITFHLHVVGAAGDQRRLAYACHLGGREQKHAVKDALAQVARDAGGRAGGEEARSRGRRDRAQAEQEHRAGHAPQKRGLFGGTGRQLHDAHIDDIGHVARERKLAKGLRDEQAQYCHNDRYAPAQKFEDLHRAPLAGRGSGGVGAGGFGFPSALRACGAVAFVRAAGALAAVAVMRAVGGFGFLTMAVALAFRAFVAVAVAFALFALGTVMMMTAAAFPVVAVMRWPP